MELNLIELAIVIITLIFFSLLSFKKHSLTNRGIIFANIVGILVYRLGGISSFLVIVAFFAIAESCTRYARAKLRDAHEKRTTANIFGNSGAAVIALILGAQIAFYGAVAAALADTISSEIGMLSKSKPRLITNFKKVGIGTDGGVTLLGLVAGLIGALIISLLYFYLERNILIIWVLTIAGFAGSLIDSFLGAIFEREGRLNNMEVNFVASICGALIAYVLFVIL